VETRPGTDPDRASFTSALKAAREELTATSRYLNRDDGRPHAATATTATTAIDITVRAPPLSPGRPRRYTPARPRPPQPPSRRQKITGSSPASPRATGRHANSRPCSTSTPPRGSAKSFLMVIRRATRR
jgi:hypothetical protein